MSWLVKEVLVSHSELSLFFVELRVQRSPDGPRLAAVTGEDSCFSVYEVEILQL